MHFFSVIREMLGLGWDGRCVTLFRSVPLMKIFLSSLSASIVLIAAPVHASDTAYNALRAACIGQGRDAQNRVIELSGMQGKPQPGVWKVTLEDSKGGIIELDVQGNRVVGKRSSSIRPSGSKLNISVIQLDSDGVFSIANDEAVKAGVGFDRVNYTLTAANQSGLPTWTVELFDGPVNRVGTLKIGADNAFILERSPELAVSESQKRDRRWSKPGEPVKSVPDAFHRFGLFGKSTGYKLKNWANGYGWTDDKNPTPPSE